MSLKMKGLTGRRNRQAPLLAGSPYRWKTAVSGCKAGLSQVRPSVPTHRLN